MTTKLDIMKCSLETLNGLKIELLDRIEKEKLDLFKEMISTVKFTMHTIFPIKLTARSTELAEQLKIFNFYPGQYHTVIPDVKLHISGNEIVLYIGTNLSYLTKNSLNSLLEIIERFNIKIDSSDNLIADYQKEIETNLAYIDIVNFGLKKLGLPFQEMTINKNEVEPIWLDMPDCEGLYWLFHHNTISSSPMLVSKSRYGEFICDDYAIYSDLGVFKGAKWMKISLSQPNPPK